MTNPATDTIADAATMIFVNLPVTDLTRSIAFYEGLGAKVNPKFSDETAACLMVSGTIYVMVLTHEKWKSFTDRKIPDAHASAQVLLCLSYESREAVDAAVGEAARKGGKADPNPPQDYGFMYGRSYADPDGHIWEAMWMDAVAAEQGPEAYATAQHSA